MIITDYPQDHMESKKCSKPPTGYMGVSENSVPLNPMVNDHYIPIKWL